MRFPKKLPAAQLRRIIQTAFLAFMILTGIRFLLHYLWMTGASAHAAGRPATVEAFLPISGLLALKRLLLTGEWDTVHPAGLAILMMALASAVLFRRAFCSHLCPLGAVSFLLFRLGRRLGITWVPGPRAYAAMSIPKYLLLAFFLYLPLSMSVRQISFFLLSPYNVIADAKMLLFFMPPSLLTACCVTALAWGSVVIPGFWCRCLCPYGALLGILSLLSPVSIRRDGTGCTSCGRCAAACPQGLRPDTGLRMAGTECLACMECAGACGRGCLTARAGRRSISGFGISLGLLALVALMYAGAELTGHWDHAIPEEMMRRLLESAASISH